MFPCSEMRRRLFETLRGEEITVEMLVSDPTVINEIKLTVGQRRALKNGIHLAQVRMIGAIR